MCDWCSQGCCTAVCDTATLNVLWSDYKHAGEKVLLPIILAMGSKFWEVKSYVLNRCEGIQYLQGVQSHVLPLCVSKLFFILMHLSLSIDLHLP